MLVPGKSFPYIPMSHDAEAMLFAGLGLDPHDQPPGTPLPRVIDDFYMVTRHTVLAEGDPPADSIIEELATRCVKTVGVPLAAGVRAFEAGALVYSAMLRHDTRVKGLPIESSVVDDMLYEDSADLAFISMKTAQEIPDVPRIMALVRPNLESDTHALSAVALAGAGQVHTLVVRSIAVRLKRDPGLLDFPGLVADTDYTMY